MLSSVTLLKVYLFKKNPNTVRRVIAKAEYLQLIWIFAINGSVPIWESLSDHFSFFSFVELTRKYNEAIHGYIFLAGDDTPFLCEWIFSEKQHRLWACSSVQRCQGTNFEDLGKAIHLCVLSVSISQSSSCCINSSEIPQL